MTTSTSVRSTTTTSTKLPDWATEAVAEALPPIATSAELQKFLRTSERTLRRYVAEGRLRAIGTGVGSSRLRFDRRAVAELIAGLAR